ncbi:MAG: ParB/RepB/Spo0J family partition protein [Oceanicaulis sp.]
MTAATAEAPAGTAEANGVRPLPPEPVNVRDTALLAELAGRAEPALALELARALDRFDPVKKRFRSDLVLRSLRSFADQGLVKLSHEGEGATITPRGLAIWRALSGQTDQPGEGGAFGVIHDLIEPDPDNPRTLFDGDAIEDLAQSIADAGQVLQNLILRRHPDAEKAAAGRFMIVGGERRWRAVGTLIKAGRWPWNRPLPAIVRDYAEDDPHAARVDALVENLQRVNLSPLEEAESFERLRKAGLSTARIAERIGRTQRNVQQRLQLLKLDPADRARLASGEITVEQARAMLSAGSGDQTAEASAPRPIPAARQRQFWTEFLYQDKYIPDATLIANLSRRYRLSREVAEASIHDASAAGVIAGNTQGWRLASPDVQDTTPPAPPPADDPASLYAAARAKVLDALEDLARIVVTEISNSNSHNLILSALESGADGLKAAHAREKGDRK